MQYWRATLLKSEMDWEKIEVARSCCICNGLKLNGKETSAGNVSMYELQNDDLHTLRND